MLWALRQPPPCCAALGMTDFGVCMETKGLSKISPYFGVLLKNVSWYSWPVSSRYNEGFAGCPGCCPAMPWLCEWHQPLALWGVCSGRVCGADNGTGTVSTWDSHPCPDLPKDPCAQPHSPSHWGALLPAERGANTDLWGWVYVKNSHCAWRNESHIVFSLSCCAAIFFILSLIKCLPATAWAALYSPVSSYVVCFIVFPNYCMRTSRWILGMNTAFNRAWEIN